MQVDSFLAERIKATTEAPYSSVAHIAKQKIERDGRVWLLPNLLGYNEENTKQDMMKPAVEEDLLPLSRNKEKATPVIMHPHH